MSTEANKEVVRRYQEAYNRGDLEALDAFVNPHLVTHSLMPGLPTGLEGGKQAHRMTVSSGPALPHR